MKPQAEKSRPVRMFVALELSETALDEIERWGERELTDPALRRVPRESLHVTLAFLGNKPPEVSEQIALAMEEVAGIPVPMTLGDPVGRPQTGRPRLVALPVDFSRPVAALQERLSEILVSDGLHKPEERPFWPHVTVARVRAEGGGSRRPARVDVPSGPSPTARVGFFDGVRISLYRSELQPSGARYVPLAQVELPGRGWQ